MPSNGLHALQQNMKNIEIRTVDTDVIVILAGVFYDLLVIQPLADIWVAFGVCLKTAREFFLIGS